MGKGQLRVAIVGGGIGGLTAALFLRRAGIDAHVYEQAPALREVGAGIQLGPNATRLLLRLGLGERLQKVAVCPEAAWEFRRWDDGRVLFRQPFGEEHKAAFGAPYYVVHRADLVNVLRDALPDDIIHLNHRCIGVTQHRRGVELAFANGTKLEVDAVIGADGIHSVVRNAIVPSLKARFSGLCAYRGLVPIERTPLVGRPPAVTIWLGPHRHFVHYPVSGGRLVNFVAVVPAGDWTIESWTADGRVEDAIAEFQGWHEDVRSIIGAASETKRWALYDREPLERWSVNRVTLLGDAAHAMLPFLAQGACQAIEDAAVLAGCLRDISPDEVPEAFRRYEAIRRPRTSMIQELSRIRGQLYHLPDGEEQRRRDEQLASSDPFKTYAWLYGHDVETEVTGKGAA